MKLLNLFLLIGILALISTASAATTIAFKPVPLTPSAPATFNATIYTSGIPQYNASYVLANVTFPRLDMVVSNCYKNNSHIDGISFTVINLTSTVTSVQINATNSSQLFGSGASLESIFDLQLRYYNATSANNDSVPFDTATLQWYGNTSTISTGYHAFDSTTNGWVNATLTNSGNQQDIAMIGTYVLTVTVTASDTGLPIPGYVIADSTGQNATANSAGISTLNEPYSTAAGSLFATGYVSRGWSIVVDNDTSVAYQMTPASTSPQSNVIYIPQQVRFRFYDQSGNALDGMYVSATPLNFTAPSDWTQKLFGISSSVNINGTTTYGYTGSEGSWATPMLASFQYKMHILDASRSVNYNFTLYPSQSEYVYTIPIGFVNISPLVSSITYSMGNATINSTAEFLNMSYVDITAGTTYLAFTVYNQSSVAISTTTYTGASANSQTATIVLPHTSGESYRYGISASQSAYGWINETKTLTFEQHLALYGTSPSWIEYWLAVGLLVLFGAAFSIFSIRFGMISLPLLAFFFEHVLGWFTIGIAGDAAFMAMMVLGIISYIRQSENKIP